MVKLPSKLHERGEHCQKTVTLLGVFDRVGAQVSYFAIVNFRNFNTSPTKWWVTPKLTDELIPSELSTLTSTYENTYIYIYIYPPAPACQGPPGCEDRLCSL